MHRSSRCHTRGSDAADAERESAPGRACTPACPAASAHAASARRSAPRRRVRAEASAVRAEASARAPLGPPVAHCWQLILVRPQPPAPPRVAAARLCGKRDVAMAERRPRLTTHLAYRLAPGLAYLLPWTRLAWTATAGARPALLRSAALYGSRQRPALSVAVPDTRYLCFPKYRYSLNVGKP